MDVHPSRRNFPHISNPPFVNELARSKRIANRILQVLSVKIEGNEAFIEVSTNSGGTINGRRYPYGSARIEMLGEAGYFGQKRTANVDTLTRVRLLRFDDADRERITRRYPAIAARVFLNLNKIQAERMASTMARAH